MPDVQSCWDDRSDGRDDTGNAEQTRRDVEKSRRYIGAGHAIMMIGLRRRCSAGWWVVKRVQF